MRFTWIIAMIAAVTAAASSVSQHGRQLKFRRLSASQVYRELRQAGREDAIPEGRVITQGIAAFSGFTMGVSTGMNIAMLVNLATSNTTREWLNNLNITGLSGSSNSGTPAKNQTQEICFNTRSLNDVDDSEDDDQANARQAPGTTPGTTTGTVTGPPVGTTAPPPTVPAPTSPPPISSGPPPTGPPPISSGPSPTATPPVTGGPSPTAAPPPASPAPSPPPTVPTGTGTNTNTATTTGPSKPITCIVINKPSARKRRSTTAARMRRAARRQH